MLPNDLGRHRQLKTAASNPIKSNNYEDNEKLSSLTKHVTDEINLINLESIHITQDRHTDNEKQLEEYQMKMLEEFLHTSKDTKITESQCLTSEEEFQRFFDNYEFHNKTGPAYKLTNNDIQVFEKAELDQARLDNIFSINKSKPELSDNLVFQAQTTNGVFNYIDNDEPPKLLEPRLSELGTLDEEKLEIEDLIEEVMIEKNLEKHLLKEASIVKEKEENKFVSIPKIETVVGMPKTAFDSESLDQSKIFDEIVTKNESKLFKTAVKFPETHSNISAGVVETKTKLEQKALTEELVTKYDVKYLETVKKIDKVFQKRSILKSDVDKAKLTKGPCLYEKTVVLPQIMQRLKERNMALEAQSMMRMRFILDVGPSHTITQTPLHMSQSNVQWPTKTEKHSFSLSATTTKPEASNTSKILNSQNSTLLNTLKALNSQNLTVFNSLKVQNSQSNPKVMDFQNPKIPKVQNPQNPNVSKPKQNTGNPNELNPPEVLMADCNKERLKAHIAAKLFESFVRGE